MSKALSVVTDHNLLEQISYEKEKFPYHAGVDIFDHFINGEINCHWHEEVEFDYVLEGEMECRIHLSSGHEKTEILQAGDGVFINTKYLHSAIQRTPGTRAFYLLFPAELFKLSVSKVIFQKYMDPVLKTAFPGLFLFSEKQEDVDILSSIKMISRLSSEDPALELKLLEKLCHLWQCLYLRLQDIEKLDIFSRQETLKEQRIRVMTAFINRHYPKNITIDQIASSAHISRSECFRCFQTVVKKSPVEYLTEYRLSIAAKLLRITSRSIQDIGTGTGFHQPSYFGKLFKKTFGLSPSQYRNKTGPVP